MSERSDEKSWYDRSFRRILLDFHIADWNEEFLSRFDPAEFASCVARAKSTAATVFANTHTGLCNYPTKVGRAHRGVGDRDLLGSMIDACHKRGIDAVVYYCTIYVDWYWDNHPEARIVDARGNSDKLLMNSAGRPRRFSVCCPNNQEYRQFVVAQLKEICEGYEFEGVWPDMTFWPTVCYCRSCRERFEREAGEEIPRIINWEDPAWVRFQRTRQRWLLDFIHLVTSTIKAVKPEVSVAHQSHTFYGDWLFGPSTELADEMDWLSADLYGGRYELSFFSKLFYGLSTRKPFEHINSWCYPNIHEHVISRTEDHLRVNAFSSFINQGAMVFIDAVDPLGTIRTRNYETVGKIFGELERYESDMGGRLCGDIGIYYSFGANFDLAENDQDVSAAGYNFEPGKKLSSPVCHRNAAINFAKTLVQSHTPFRVVTKRDLSRLADYQIILLPNVVMIDEEEAEALKTYVQAGGCVYASKHTSLVSIDGVRQGNFMLSDLFGADFLGETKEIVTYIAPRKENTTLFPHFSSDLPITIYDSQLKVSAHDTASVLATVTLPYTDPTDTRYASILTDPPGIRTDYPAVLLNRYGKGSIIYASGVLESCQHESQRQILVNLLKHIRSRPFYFESDAPKAVEITLFEQEDRRRYVLNFLNHQQELPNIPIYGIHVTVNLHGREPKQLVVLPDGENIDFKQKGELVTFALPELKDYLMTALSYR